MSHQVTTHKIVNYQLVDDYIVLRYASGNHYKIRRNDIMNVEPMTDMKYSVLWLICACLTLALTKNISVDNVSNNIIMISWFVLFILVFVRLLCTSVIIQVESMDFIMSGSIFDIVCIDDWRDHAK